MSPTCQDPHHPLRCAPAPVLRVVPAPRPRRARPARGPGSPPHQLGGPQPLTGAGASPPERRDGARVVAGPSAHHPRRRRHPRHAGAERRRLRRLLHIACWPTLQRVCPELRDVDLATSELPSIAAARDAYEAIRASRDDVAAIYSEFDKDIYHLLDGEARARYWRATAPPPSRPPPASCPPPGCSSLTFMTASLHHLHRRRCPQS